jgi:hypothetical protein
VGREKEASGLRLAELVCALAFATDLARGKPMEHELRTCLPSISGSFSGSRRTNSPRCTTWRCCAGSAAPVTPTSSRHGSTTRWAAHARAATFDFGRPLDVLTDIIRLAGARNPPVRRARTVVATLASCQKGLEELFRSGCEVAQTLADRLGFTANIGRALGQVFERWDGRGWPRGIGGEEFTVSARIVQVA